MRRILSLLLLVVAVPLLCAGRAAAQSGGERIASYAAVLSVEPNGDLVVQETIDYDFGSSPRHGIFRDIPVRVHFDDKYDRVYPLKVLSVEGSPGTPVQYETSDVGNNKRIKIGDPDRTITGLHTYVVTYRVRGAANGFADHDELYWNPIGLGWDVPIERAQATVHVPGTVTQAACFAGPLESRLPCGSQRVDGSTASFTQEHLAPHEAFTVVVGMPKGAIPEPKPILKERWSADRAFSRTPATVGLAGGLSLLALAGGIVLGWRTGRDERFVGSPVDVAFGNASGEVEAVPLLDRTETPVEYEPPDKLRPGQIGTLVDEIANPLDVTATIIDLAVRGYLRIEEIPKHGWFGKPDWNLVRLKDDTDDLLPYERKLFDALLPSPGVEVALSSLRNTFAKHIQTVQNALYDDAVENGWFLARPDKIRTRWTVLGVLVLAAGVGVTVLLAALTHAGLLGLPLVVAGIVLLALRNKMPRRTAKGTGTLRRAFGFRRFIEESEKERARFAERQNLFSEYLPYAVVFGATEKWAKAFEGLATEPPDTSWYVGTHPFSYPVFAHSMDGFAVASAGTLTSTPSGSGGSGFGGGGFSGGGGGGGGGGSW
jgi:uncharacterized protein (TIGR04222 family)